MSDGPGSFDIEARTLPNYSIEEENTYRKNEEQKYIYNNLGKATGMKANGLSNKSKNRLQR